MSTDEKIAWVRGGGEMRRIEIKRQLNAGLQTVWDALTDHDKVQNWLGSGGYFEAREGGRVCLHNGTDCDTGADDLGQDGTVKVFQAPHLFEYTWNDRLENPGLVHFDLVALDALHTELTLINFVPAHDIVGAAAGWHQITELLEDQLVDDQWQPMPIAEGRWRELCEVYQQSG